MPANFNEIACRIIGAAFIWLIALLLVLIVTHAMNLYAQLPVIAPFITGAFVLIAAYLPWLSVQKQIGIADQRSKAEITALNKAIYSELADRSGRCVNDFMSLSEPFPPSTEAAKYRPIDSAVLPGVGGTLGLLKPEALLAVTQFYSRLAGVAQAIDTVKDFKLIKDRLQVCLAPALSTLDRLDVPEAEKGNR